MNKSLLIAFVSVVASVAQAQVITQWNFNSVTPDANTGTGTLTPNTGAGTAATFGGATNSFASGDASGGSSDPASGDDSGFQTTTYSAPSTGSGTRGVEFTISSLGFKNLKFTFDTRFSNTSSKWLEVTAFDGTNWSSVGTVENTLGGDKWVNGNSFTLGSAFENNAALVLRVAPIFAPSSTNYAPSNPSTSYASAGTLRYDMVTLSGEPVPEPASMIALGLGAVAMLRRRSAK